MEYYFKFNKIFCLRLSLVCLILGLLDLVWGCLKLADIVHVFYGMHDNKDPFFLVFTIVEMFTCSLMLVGSIDMDTGMIVPHIVWCILNIVRAFVIFISVLMTTPLTLRLLQPVLSFSIYFYVYIFYFNVIFSRYLEIKKNIMITDRKEDYV